MVDNSGAPPSPGRGEHHPNAVLTNAEVALIRELYADGFYSYRTLAQKFDVSKETIRDIVKERRRIYG